MGYSLSRQVVESNRVLLEKIKRNLLNGKSTVFPDTGEERFLSRIQYHISRVLAAAKVYGEGWERELRDQVTVSLDASLRAVVVKRKGTGRFEGISAQAESAASPTGDLRSERDVIRGLEGETKRFMTEIEFRPSPSFNEEEFAAALKAIGWRLHPPTKKELDAGFLQYAVDRIEGEVEEKPGAFDLIRRARERKRPSEESGA